jgi:hypothetical protein
MDSDTTDAAWAAQELNEHERLENDYGTEDHESV